VLRNNDGIFRSIGQAQPGAAGPCKLNTGEPDGGLRAGTREEPEPILQRTAGSVRERRLDAQDH